MQEGMTELLLIPINNTRSGPGDPRFELFHDLLPEGLVEFVLGPVEQGPGINGGKASGLALLPNAFAGILQEGFDLCFQGPFRPGLCAGNCRRSRKICSIMGFFRERVFTVLGQQRGSGLV